MGLIGQVIESQQVVLGKLIDDNKLTDTQKEYVFDRLAEMLDECRSKHSEPTVEEPEIVEATFVASEQDEPVVLEVEEEVGDDEDTEVELPVDGDDVL